MLKYKIVNVFIIALMLLQAIAPIPALAMAGANLSEYPPGSVVTISGDSSAGFLPAEAVHVEVSGPNGFGSSCEAIADENGAWSCQVTLPADAAAGSYEYTASGQDSGVSQSGGFTVTAPPAPTVEPTQEPTQIPTTEPTTEPTQEPTVEPTTEPTSQPTVEPTQAPTQEPTSQPTEASTQAPTASPTSEPTVVPTATAPVTPARPPFIRSDKDDYAPAEIVTLTSGNWQPGEWVVIYVNDSAGQTWSITTNRQADESGAFIYEFNLPNWFVATYHVTATGDVSGVATTDFTDANLASLSLNVPTSVTVAPGGSAGYTVNVSMGGNSSTCTVTLSVTTALPSGATATFGGGANPHNATNSNFSRTLTINTTAATPPGSYPFTVQAARGSNCQGSGNLTTSGTLVVVKRVGTVTVGSQTGALTFGTGSSATYLISVNRNGATGTGFTANLSLSTSLPAGASVSFSPASLVFSTTDTSKTSTLTITTNATTPAGSTAFTVQATNSALSGDNSTGNGTLLIAKVTPTITWANPANITYGTALSATQLNATASVPGSFVYFPASGTVLDAGDGQTLSVSFTPTDTTNYNNTAKNVSINVLKASSTTTLTCPSSVIYNGSAQKPCTATVTGAGELNQSLTINYSNNTNAGNASASASFAGDGNHTGSSDSESFTISPASSTTIVTCPASMTYDGSSQEPCSATVTGAGGLNQSLPVTYSDNTNAGTASASASYAGDANYSSSSDSKTFEITKASSAVTVICSANVTYNGSAQEPCAASVSGAGGLDQSLSVTYTDNVNAGTATASASYAGDDNHEASNDSETFEIVKASSITTLTCPANVIYSGEAQMPCTAEVTGAGDLSESLTVDYSDNTNAGTVTASATYAGDANHETSSDSTTFEILPASSTTVVTCPVSQTYTGAAIEPCTVSVTGAGGLNLTTDPVYADNLDAGTASASYTFAGDANHTGSSDSETFEITKAGTTIVVTCPANVTYNGSAHTPCTAEVTGAGGLSETLTVEYTYNTDAGTAVASANYTGDDNHEANSNSKTFTIDKASSTTTITCPTNGTYTGFAQEPCTATVSGAGGLSQSLSVTYSDNINAGTASASASYAGDANHESSSDSETFAIDQAPSTTLVTCPASVTYTGAALESCSASVTGVGGLNESLTVVYSNNTDAGTASASTSYAGDANHTGSNDSKTFEILKASSTVVVTCLASVTYDGFAQELCTAEVTGDGGLIESLAVNYTDNTNAGIATASASYAGDANHEASDDSKTFEIVKASSTTTVVCVASVTYNGSAQEPCSASVTGAGNLDEILSVTYSNNTDSGTATASSSYTGDANHEASSDGKTFEITKASSTTAITCPTNVTYNGSAQELCTATVTGAGGLDTFITVDYTDNTNAGTATASASYIGDVNHEASDDTETFTIDKADAVIVVNGYSGIYDGLAHGATGSATGVESTPADLTSLLHLGDSFTNVPGGSSEWTFDGNENYNATGGSVVIDISKADAIIVVNGYSDIYDGLAHGATGSASGVEIIPADLTSLLHLGDSFTDVPGGTAYWTFDGNQNYSASNGSVEIEITKADAIIDVTPYDVLYDGSAYTATGSALGVLGESLSGLDLSGTTHTDAGTYNDSWTFTDGTGNYNDAIGNVTDKIAKVSVSIVVTPYDVTYDGKAHTATGTATGVNGEDLSADLDLSGTTHTDAGNYAGDPWTFTDTTGNYDDASGTVDNNIDKADASITVNGYSDIYDGGSHGATGSATGVNGEDLSAGLNLGDSFTNVPGGTAYWMFSGGVNYNDDNGSVEIVIEKADATIVVTPFDVTFDGTPHTATGTATGVNGEDLSSDLDLSGTTHTDAGSYTDSWTFTDSTGNYNDDGGNITDNIDKADAVIDITPYSVTYDGNAHTATGSATGVAGEDLSSLLDLSGTTHTDAGDYPTDAWSFVGDGNYNAANGTVNDAISQASSSTAVTCPASAAYTGASIEPCSATVTGAGGLNETLSVTYSNNIDAGIATAEASYTGDANHTGSGNSKTFTISAASSSTVVTCPANVTYDGSTQEPCSATVTGPSGLSETLTVVYTDNVNAGTATASASYSGEANYASSTNSTTFEITKAPSTVTVTCPVSVTYDGSAQEPCTAEVTGVGGLSETLSVDYTDNTNAGTATANANFAGDTNHEATANSATFEITKAYSSVTASCPISVIYSGSAQTPCSASVTGAGGLNEILTMSYTDNTNVGTATASASYAGDANHTDSSYSGTFTISKASSTTTVTCPASVPYTGTAQTPCSASVTGAGSLNQSLAVTYANNTSAGTATASANYPGDANHEASSNSSTFAINNVSSAPMCSGRTATIYVNAQGRIVGGPDNGKVYKGVLNGTNHQDVIVGSTRSDVIDAKDGHDVVCGGNGNDTLKGGTGNDRLFGDAGTDVLNGDGHNDTLTGGSNADQFNGGVGNDSATDFNPGKGDVKSSVEKS